uniref:PDZ domain-containing protein n=1 Tax=Anopheles culicifacies TaxID=139723 RepID=A0A182LTP2_9DIPT
MNSHFFPGRTTPETMVGGIRKWEQLSRTSVNRTFVPFDGEFQSNPELPRKEDFESDQEQYTDDQVTEQHYSESEFHTEQEEDSGDEQTQKDKNESVWDERGQIRVSQYPPTNIEPEGHLLHIDFIANQLERLEVPGSGQGKGNRRTIGTLGSGLSTRKLPGQQHNISFSRERVREIERTNQILLRRIITTRPTLQTQNSSKPVKRSSSTNASPVTSAAANRRKMQERIAAENELLIRKGEGGKIGVTLRRIHEGRLLICAVTRRSPAYMAGLRYGDEILCLENEPISGMMELEQVRDLVQKNLRNSIKLRTQDKLGERYVTIARDMEKGFGFRFMNGEITFVRPNTMAERRGLERRLQIIEVNEEVVVGMQDEDIEAIIYASDDVVTLCVVPVKVYRQLFSQ